MEVKATNKGVIEDDVPCILCRDTAQNELTGSIEVYKCRNDSGVVQVGLMHVCCYLHLVGGCCLADEIWLRLLLEY